MEEEAPSPIPQYSSYKRAFGSPSIMVANFTYFYILLCKIINSIKQQSFVSTQTNDQTVLFQTIQCSIICLHSVYVSNSSI